MQITEQMLEDLLEEMSESGDVFAICPLCRIPLSKEERTDCRCGTCGPLNNSDILFRINDAKKC